MSSIYKKGRDGYYYYQTYLYNSLTKKKDKRVYHALGTKILSEALEKRKDLDLKYEKELHIDTSTFNNRKSINKIFPIIFIIFLVLLFNILFKNYNKKFVTTNFKLNKTLPEIQNDTLKNQVEIKNQVVLKKEIKADSFSNNLPILPKDHSFEIYSIDSTILSSASKQCYVIAITNNVKLSNEAKKIICLQIKKKLSRFKNIIICLYENDKSSYGSPYIHTIPRSKNNNWIAMYSFNSVEGEYFDPKPNSYMNTN